MKSQQPYIKSLLEAVEQYHSRPIRTTVDFEALSITVEQQTSERISASTLKRLWGYVNDKHEPRRYTLDVLSKYIGRKDFDTFCEWLSSQNLSDSDFFTSTKILSAELAFGTHIEIGWSPNRYIILEYLGDNRYKVVRSDIIGSSLYLEARHNIISHNGELFTIMRTSFPTTFWHNTQQLYQKATDSIALELKSLPPPKLSSNYLELSYDKQQEENLRYREAEKSYNRSTIMRWAVAYRKEHNLSPLPAELLGYYD